MVTLWAIMCRWASASRAIQVENSRMPRHRNQPAGPPCTAPYTAMPVVSGTSQAAIAGRHSATAGTDPMSMAHNATPSSAASSTFSAPAGSNRKGASPHTAERASSGPR